MVSQLRPHRIRTILSLGLLIQIGATGAAQAFFNEPVQLIGPSNGPLLIRVTTFGKSGLFVVDTGASICVLDHQLESRLAVHGTTEARTANGTVTLTTYRAPAMKLLDEPLVDGCESVVMDMSPFRAVTGIPIEGIVGVNALNNRVVRITTDHRRLELLNSVPDDSGESIPVEWPQHGGAEIAFKVAGAHTERCLVDTGSMGEITLRAGLFDFLRDAGAITRVREIQAETANGLARKQEGILNEMALRNWKHSGVIVKRGTTSSYVGLKYLRRFTMTIDFPGRRLFLKPGNHFSDKSRRSCLGVGIYDRDGAVALKFVIPGSPAANAGLRADDVLTAVNGKPVTGSEIYRLRGLFETAGQTVSLSIRDGDRTVIKKTKLVDF